MTSINCGSELSINSLKAAQMAVCLTRVFNGYQCYLMKATTPCVVAYAYARIRRLVRLGAGFYRLSVAENTAIGFGSPD